MKFLQIQFFQHFSAIPPKPKPAWHLGTWGVFTGRHIHVALGWAPPFLGHHGVQMSIPATEICAHLSQAK